MDWKQMLTELMAAGMTQRAIADEVGLTQGAISQLLTGRTATMQWEKGEKLRELYRTRVSPESASAAA